MTLYVRQLNFRKQLLLMRCEDRDAYWSALALILTSQRVVELVPCLGFDARRAQILEHGVAFVSPAVEEPVRERFAKGRDPGTVEL